MSYTKSDYGQIMAPFILNSTHKTFGIYASYCKKYDMSCT